MLNSSHIPRLVCHEKGRQEVRAKRQQANRDPQPGIPVQAPKPGYVLLPAGVSGVQNSEDCLKIAMQRETSMNIQYSGG